MISVAQIVEYIETGLNAAIPTDQGWQFKIWANAGKRTKPQRNGNNVVYYVEGVLQTTTSAIEPNTLIMGVNGLSLDFAVKAQPPRTSAAQTSQSLEEVQDGQIYFINLVANVLSEYFTKSQSFQLTDSDGNTYGVAMFAGVALPSVIDISSIGVAVPMSVSITLNFVLGGINALDIKLYMDGERVPYQSFSPSRAGQMSTNVQSNTTAQTNLATSSLYAISLTCPSANNNYASQYVLNYIQSPDINTGHFITVEWSDTRTDIYLMTASSANAMVAQADFAGLTVNLCEAYEIEYMNFPDQFIVGVFNCAASTATSLSFTINASVSTTYAEGETAPESIQFMYYICGQAYVFTVPQTSTTPTEDGGQTVVYSGTQAVTVAISSQISRTP